MIDKTFWKKIGLAQGDFDHSRHTIIGQANRALHASKEAIFALHRNRVLEAKTKIDEAEKILKGLEKNFIKNKKLRNEGSWGAAMEEFLEARLFLMFVEGKKVGAVAGLKIEPNEYLGALSDYSGELVRRAVLLASKRQFDSVAIIAQEIEEVIHFLLSLNLSGVLRTKFDQAKNNLRKIEEIMYDISLKK